MILKILSSLKKLETICNCCPKKTNVSWQDWSPLYESILEGHFAPPPKEEEGGEEGMALTPEEILEFVQNGIPEE